MHILFRHTRCTRTAVRSVWQYLSADEVPLETGKFATKYDRRCKIAPSAHQPHTLTRTRGVDTTLTQTGNQQSPQEVTVELIRGLIRALLCACQQNCDFFHRRRCTNNVPHYNTTDTTQQSYHPCQMLAWSILRAIPPSPFPPLTRPSKAGKLDLSAPVYCSTKQYSPPAHHPLSPPPYHHPECQHPLQRMQRR